MAGWQDAPEVKPGSTPEWASAPEVSSSAKASPSILDRLGSGANEFFGRGDPKQPKEFQPLNLGKQALKAGAFLVPGSGLASMAASGALYGAGASDAEDAQGIGKDALLGGAGGAAFGGALKVAGKVASPMAKWLGDRLSSGAESAAVRATNADRTAYRAAFGKPANTDKIHDVGRFLLDEKVPLRSPSAMQEGLSDVLDAAGQKIGDLAKGATKAGAKADLEGAMLRAMEHPDVAGLSKNTELAAAGKRVTAFIDDQIKQHGGEVTPEVLWDIRRQLDPLSKWNKLVDPPEVAAAYRAVRRSVNDELGASISRALPEGGWAEANSAFAKGSTAKKLADVGAERRAANRLASPSEKAAGIAGLGVGAVANPLAGVAIPLATAGLNRFAMPVAATTMNALGKGLSALPGAEVGPVTAVAGSRLSPELQAWLENLRRVRMTPAAAEPESP